MDKSSRSDIPLSEQRDAWNRWNAANARRSAVSQRQATFVEERLRRLGRRDLELIDIGCGSGWMSERLLAFGRVTGTDLADEVLEDARARLPAVRFVAGDFLSLPLERERYDAAVALEVLSHVANPAALLDRVHDLLAPGGVLLIATQNRPVLEHWSQIGLPIPGQLRRWVDHTELRRLLRSRFDVLELTSIMPVGDQGLLRFVNSWKLNRLAQMFVARSSIERLKERLLLGHTLVALARRRSS